MDLIDNHRTTLLKDIEDRCRTAGGTDFGYLHHHFDRFFQTRQEVLSTWRIEQGKCLLDIGAHWLHQAMLYVDAGFTVTAVDIPITFDMPEVRSLAASHNIRLISEPRLDTARALQSIPDDSIDIVLFTEIIEHITFNPVAMWREIYRVLRPGARIVVTTPNYYAARGRAWAWKRFMQRFGGGINVTEILNVPTHGHHWKEYSLRELIYYFCVLSPDFNCVKARHVAEYRDGYLGVPSTVLTGWLERKFGIFRPNIHLEIELKSKNHGIQIVPSW